MSKDEPPAGLPDFAAYAGMMYTTRHPGSVLADRLCYAGVVVALLGLSALLGSGTVTYVQLFWSAGSLVGTGVLVYWLDTFFSYLRFRDLEKAFNLYMNEIDPPKGKDTDE